MTFDEALVKVQTLKTKPENDELLELYALYKQATEGDNVTPEPGPWDFIEKIKWNHWNSKKGMTKENAMIEYINQVEKLISKYGLSL